MKKLLLTLVVAGCCCYTAFAVAKVSGGTFESAPRISRCANTINAYLELRRDTSEPHVVEAQALEDRIDVVCKGFKIRLVQQNGVTTGVIEE